MEEQNKNLLDMSISEISSLCESLGEKKYRGKQLAAWIFRRGVTDFNQMSDIAQKTRDVLSRSCHISLPRLIKVDEDAAEGSKKILWQLHDGWHVESVLIKEKDHYTLCVSSQVGCALGCRFCRTGLMGFVRNLSSGEIIGQLLASYHLCRGLPLTNMVFMGMGEPLLNRENVVKALSIITDPFLIAMSAKRISISTVGIIPEIEKLMASKLNVGLTISLSAPDGRLRDQIMPVNKKYPMDKLKHTLTSWPLKPGRRLTIAYVLLKGINDQPEQALALSRFLSGLKVKINLIPFNPWPGAEYSAPTEKSVEQFQKILAEKNHTVMVRWSKGRKVSAACGQLYAENTREQKH